MKKIIIFLVLFCLFSLNTFALYEKNIPELNNIKFIIKGKNISGQILYIGYKDWLDIKYLDPINKMNFTNNIIVKLKWVNSQVARDLESVLQVLWNEYSMEVLENKRNTTVLILEGWNIFDIDTYLTQRSLISKWEYIDYVESREKIIALSEFFPFLDTQVSLEWYLYPDTYKISPTWFKINNFVILQLNNFENKVYNTLFIDEITKKWLYSNSIIESVINLASIVEKEEKNINQKPIVAGILKKRLKEYRQLWADITVCYPYRLTSNECRLVISKYIRIKTPYNTRIILGLPPTPINNPSYKTINATLNDTKTDYYYYLHDVSTGEIFYGRNYSEHQWNIKKYLK